MQMIKMAKNDATRYHKCNQGNCVVRVMNVYILPSVSRPPFMPEIEQTGRKLPYISYLLQFL